MSPERPSTMLRAGPSTPLRASPSAIVGVPWRKSLYWRIALGLFAFVTLMLAAEGALFLWISQRLAGAMPARSPRQLAALVSQDVGAALTRDPTLNLDRYLLTQYKDVAQTFFVVLRDGRVASNHDDERATVIAELRAEEAAFTAGRGGGRRRGGRGFGADPPPFRGPVPRQLSDMAPLFVNDEQIGRVVIRADDRPFWRIVRQMAPAMA